MRTIQQVIAKHQDTINTFSPIDQQIIKNLMESAYIEGESFQLGETMKAGKVPSPDKPLPMKNLKNFTNVLLNNVVKK